MSENSLTDLVERVVSTPANDLSGFEELLGGAFHQSDENEHWIFYRAELGTGLFYSAEYRLKRTSDQALLSLTPNESNPLKESDLDLSSWGPAESVNANPHIPPEGTDTYVYVVKGVRLAFQFTHHSRRLRTLIFRWGDRD